MAEMSFPSLNYQEKKRAAVAALLRIKSAGPVSLKPKFTSHFFRKRTKKNTLDLTNFNQVIRIDLKKKVVEVEGMTTFYDLAKAVLKKNLLPVIVPELRNITIGGTISGLGLESSSFKYGMVHDAVIECDVLTSTGEVITCSRTKNSDLFYMLPNSIGSVGYVLKCTFKLKEAKKYVKLSFLRYSDAKSYFLELEKKCRKPNSDFIDGVIYGENHFVIIEGKLVDKLPDGQQTMNFKMTPFWKYIGDTSHDQVYMKTWEYLWRWDTDTFWVVSEGWLGKLTENKVFRFTLGRYFLRSHILGKLNHLKRKYFPEEVSNEKENIIQDLCLDIKKCTRFFNWYKKEIAVYPMWICPSKHTLDKGKYVLHNFAFDYLVDIGIYTGKKRKQGKPKNYYNTLLEKKVIELQGMKGLYSESYFTKKEFWDLYNQEKYFKLKKKYDPENIFPNIYDKTIGKQTL